MQLICESNRCTGCGACQNTCALNAIHMHLDKTGFLFPIVDKSLCLNCNQCINVCPVHNLSKRYEPLSAFKGSSNSVEIKKQSSSGGIFTEIAKVVLKNGGCIVGAYLDEDLTVSHIIVDNNDSLNKLRGSKYIGSNTSGVFKQTKELLKMGKQVLFSGTPCQIAGLKNYLKEPYSNLITVDFICHGVASQALFDMYIKELEIKSHKKVKNFYFRTKARSYSSVSCMVEYDDDTRKLFRWFRTSFGYSFSAGKINRESCASCQYAAVRRVSDITLADCIHNLSLTQKQLGCSYIIVSTEMGRTIIDNCDISVSSIELEEVLKYQSHLSKPQAAHIQREQIFQNMNKGYSYLEREYLAPPKRSVVKSIKSRIKYAREERDKS